MPGIFFFTGVHEDYHQPTDTADKLDYGGMSHIVALALEMARGAPKRFVTPE